jgi:hypothetical protein
LSFSEPPGSYEACAICLWEDDLVQLCDPGRGGGANVVSLTEAQANFATHGWCEERVAAHVRAPSATDVRDPSWRRLEPGAGNTQPLPDVANPIDVDVLYYWRRHR